MNPWHLISSRQEGRSKHVDIPNKFGEGDEVTADCGAGEIRVNGVIQNGLGALGNDWEGFRLVPGINQIQCTYSDWAEEPEFVLAYREAFLIAMIHLKLLKNSFYFSDCTA